MSGNVKEQPKRSFLQQNRTQRAIWTFKLRSHVKFLSHSLETDARMCVVCIRQCKNLQLSASFWNKNKTFSCTLNQNILLPRFKQVLSMALLYTRHCRLRSSINIVLKTISHNLCHYEHHQPNTPQTLAIHAQ